MKEQITQAERDQDQADFLVDLERAARSPDASDEWLAGFVRQYYGAQPKPEAISEDVILKRLLNIIIVLGCGLAFLIFGMLAKPFIEIVPHLFQRRNSKPAIRRRDDHNHRGIGQSRPAAFAQTRNGYDQDGKHGAENQGQNVPMAVIHFAGP